MHSSSGRLATDILLLLAYLALQFPVSPYERIGMSAVTPIFFMAVRVLVPLSHSCLLRGKPPPPDVFAPGPPRCCGLLLLAFVIRLPAPAAPADSRTLCLTSQELTVLLVVHRLLRGFQKWRQARVSGGGARDPFPWSRYTRSYCAVSTYQRLWVTVRET